MLSWYLHFSEITKVNIVYLFFEDFLVMLKSLKKYISFHKMHTQLFIGIDGKGFNHNTREFAIYTLYATAT